VGTAAIMPPRPTVRHRPAPTKRLGLLARWIVVVGIIVGALLPFVPLLIWSISFSWRFPNLLPTEYSLRAWAYLASPASKLGEALVSSTAVALVVTLISVAIGLPAGRALGQHRFRWKTAVEFFILAPVIMPGIAVVMGIHILFIRYGLADTVLGVVLVHLIPTTPYVVMVLSSVFANYDPDYEDQARVLGANPVATFVRVTLPMIFPGVAVAGLFAFLISWNQYVLTLIIGGGRIITLPLLLFSFARSGDNAIAAALALVFLGPAIVMIVLTTRYLSGGASAIRGFGRL
jgi:putative spermidine/putrescine transport system permease protein